jgi:dissimilatory sulfite reductase (desulfoviridin) alpha/beta subunit
MELDTGVLKLSGFFQQVENDMFSLRLSTAGGGMLGVDYLRKAADIAEKYGREQIHLTSRQQIEIPYISRAHIASIQQELLNVGIRTFRGGPRLRTVMACLGAPICKFAQIETTVLAKRLQEKYTGPEFPAKIKIAVTGCPNNCAKVEANDIGIRGFKHGYMLYFGGSFGREIRIGKTLLPLLSRKDEVYTVIEAAIGFFCANAQKGERLGKMLERLGCDQFKKTLEEALTK